MIESRVGLSILSGPQCLGQWSTNLTMATGTPEVDPWAMVILYYFTSENLNFGHDHCQNVDHLTTIIGGGG